MDSVLLVGLLAGESDVNPVPFAMVRPSHRFCLHRFPQPRGCDIVPSGGGSSNAAALEMPLTWQSAASRHLQRLFASLDPPDCLWALGGCNFNLFPRLSAALGFFSAPRTPSRPTMCQCTVLGANSWGASSPSPSPPSPSPSTSPPDLGRQVGFCVVSWMSFWSNPIRSNPTGGRLSQGLRFRFMLRRMCHKSKRVTNNPKAFMPPGWHWQLLGWNAFLKSTWRSNLLPSVQVVCGFI